MKKLSSLLALLCSLSVWANDSKTCFESICGPVQDFSNFQEVFIKDFENEKDYPEFEAELRPLMEAYIEEQQLIWNERYQFLNEVQGDNEKLKVKASEFSIYFHTGLSPVFDNFNLLYEKNAISTINFSTALIFFDEAKARVALEGKYSPEELEWVIKLNKEFYRDSKYSRFIEYLLSKQLLPQYIFNSILKKPEISIFQAVHYEIQLMISRIDQIDLSILPAFDQELIKMAKKRLITKASMEEMPEFLLEEINGDLFVAQMALSYYLNTQDNVTNLLKEMPQSFIEKKLSEVTSLDVSKFDPKLFKQEDLENIKKESVNVCIQRARIILNVSPHESDILQIQSKLREIKSNTVDFVAKNFGSSFANYVDQKLNFLQFDVPASREFLMNYMKHDFSEDLERPGDYFYSEMALLNGDSFKPDEEGSYFSFNLDDMCAPFTPEPHINDKIYASSISPLLNISSITAKHFTNFEMIFAHELGHYIFALLKGQTNQRHSDFDQSPSTLSNITEKLKCVSSNYNKAPMHEFSIDLDTDIKFPIGQYTSEDFADLFAAAISDSSVKNSFCYLLGKDESKNVLLDLINPFPDDVHSATFYRILNVEKNLRGKLPESCERVLGAQPDLKINTCFKK